MAGRTRLLLGGAVAAFLIGALLVCVAAITVLREGGGGGSNFVAGYQEVASEVSFQVYQPGYLPPDSGEPLHRVPAARAGIQEAVARHPGGLILEQSNEQSVIGQDTTPATVQGAEEAYFADFAQRTLVLRKGGTWITLAGAPDSELVRVAESLQPVQP